MQTSQQDLVQLQNQLGYTFRDRSLLEWALTHKSYVYEGQPSAQHNERLEFLGDAILGAVIASHLYQAYPNDSEGELTKLKAVVVSQPILAASARKLKLGAYLRLGPGEAANGGADRDSNLARCLESVIGSVYLDGGFEAAYAVVMRVLKEAVQRLAGDAIKRNYKSVLQERWHLHSSEPPHYEIVATYGPEHARLFEVIVRLDGQLMGYGLGHSRKEAEQRAAQMALGSLEYSRPPVVAYIALGSNLGDRRGYLETAIQRLADLPTSRLIARSSVYETEPVGEVPQGWYLNAVVALRTSLEPQQLFERMRKIEDDLGRTRERPWGPRTIDLDLLLYGDACLSTKDLTIPHPRMHERRFVLEPLCEIAPEVQHPRLHKRIRELLEALSDDKQVRRLASDNPTLQGGQG